MNASATQAVIRCQGLRIGYREAILPPIDLEVRAGRVLTVIGRNGAGKTTWFRTLLGLVKPVAGKVARVRPELRVTYVPQVAQLDPILPVRARDVVAWGRLRRWSFLAPLGARRDRELCARALAEAEAAPFADRPYSELSEGQKQRILFARMLAAEPEMALLDEPTAAMDPVSERAAYRRLQLLAHERGLAVVVISHAVGVAVEHADEVLWLDREGGHVVHGTPAQVLGHADFCRLYGEIHVGGSLRHGS